MRKIQPKVAMVMRSNPVRTFFYFSTRKYFTIKFEFLDFLRPLDRFRVRIRVIISRFYMARRKNFTKIFTYLRSGRLSTPCPDGVDIAYQTGLI